jgi:trk system potassium uptake protein TrkA
MTRKFAIVGLGNFGLHLARELYRQGAEVLVIDRDQKIIADVKDEVSRAVVADALNKDTLEELGLADVDVAVIGLHRRMDTSILVTMYLAEMKTPQIVAVAESEDHARVLERLGATKVVFPEKDIALRMARTLLNPDMLEHVPLGTEHEIVEINVPESFWGKTIAELEVRSKYGCDIIAIKAPVSGSAKQPGESLTTLQIAPSAQTRFQRGQSMLILCNKETIKKLEKL